MDDRDLTMEDLVYNIARDLNRIANVAERFERRNRLHPIDTYLVDIAGSLRGLWWRFPLREPEQDDVPKEGVAS